MALGGGNSQEIGGVHFTVGVQGAAETKTAVDATTKSVENLGAAATNAAGAEASGGLRGFASSLKGATKPLRDAVGAVVGLVGAFTRMLGVVGLIATGLAALIKLFDDWKNAAKRAEEATRQFEAAAKDAFGLGVDNDPLSRKIQELQKTRDSLIAEVIKNPDASGAASEKIIQAYDIAVQAAKDRYDWDVRDLEARREAEAIEKRITATKELQAEQVRQQQREWDRYFEQWFELMDRQQENIRAAQNFMSEFRSQQGSMFNGSGAATDLSRMANLLESINLKGGSSFQ